MIIDNLIKAKITDIAFGLGFIKVGFAKAELLEDESGKLREWLDAGYDADMEWIKRGFEKRRDVRLILPGAKSVISLAYNYYASVRHKENLPKVSRYAWGKDYHKVLKGKLKKLCEYIEEITPFLPGLQKGRKTIYYVDDGPVMDKAWAVRAGIGWMGKHTNVINPDYGSWIFLSEIITTLEFENYDAPLEDLCGSCRICIDACPTDAIIGQYVVDSNRCISYHTIENHGDIPEDIELHGWIFGCDICQDVCPYNRNDHLTADCDFHPKDEIFNNGLNNLTKEEFGSVFSDSPVKRTGYKGWRRNLDKLKQSSQLS